MQGPMRPVSRILHLVKLERKEIVSIYFYAVVNGLILLAIPVGIQALVSFAQTNTASSSIVLLILLVVISVLLAGLMQIKQMQIIEKIQQQIFVRYSFDIAKKMPAFKLSAVDNYYLPELINRFFDVVTLQKGLAKLLLDFPLAIIQIAFGLLLLAFYHPVFIAFGVLLILIIWSILYFSGSKGLEKSIEESSYKYKVGGWLQEMARIIRSVKFSKSPDFLLKKTDENVTHYLKFRTEHFKILLLQYKTLIAFKTVITSAMLIVGTYLLLKQQLNVGQFIAAEIVILTIISSVEKLITNLDNVYDVLTAVEKIEHITDKPLETSGSILMPSGGDGISIQLKEVGFAYQNTGERVFDNISFSILPGEKVCIRGEEGAGKSSLLRLLSGSFDDFDGTVMLNNIPIKNYDLHSLRFTTGVLISQQDIFEGTLMENICLGLEVEDIREIQHLCDITGLSEYISKLKFGFDTQISATGRKLPSHAVKKILLVRALLNKPRLLLLEEPWLGLEKHNQQQIKKFLLTEMKNTTVLVIAKDAGFEAACNKTLVFDKQGCSTIVNN
jgi:ATP-binding cassette, subfamily B, bacterial